MIKDDAVTYAKMQNMTSSGIRVLGTLDGVTLITDLAASQVCFLKGTKITLPDYSQKNIEDLTLEDIVLTYNIKYLSKITDKTMIPKWSSDSLVGRFSESSIQNIWINPTDSYLVINNKLKVTKQHIIFFKRNNKFYFNFAEKLLLNDELLTDEYNYEKINLIEEIKENTNIYNFEIDKDFTYFAENYLVHHFCELCSGYSHIDL